MDGKPKLFLIDCQVDFCDPNGNLSVPGADKDIERLSKMIDDNIDEIEDINITLDSHNRVHIAHPIWHVNTKGEHPDPYTIITSAMYKSGEMRAFNSDFQEWTINYIETLEKGGRYPLCIWPFHCLIGTPGHNLMPMLIDALAKWESKFRLVNKVTKGSNSFTEHYSAVKAEVIRDDDKTTMLNKKLVSAIKKGDGDILIGGEALDYCVANTIRDLTNEFSDEQVKRFVLLEDATSSVGAVPNLGDDFINEMTGKGMRLAKTNTYFS